MLNDKVGQWDIMGPLREPHKRSTCRFFLLDTHLVFMKKSGGRAGDQGACHGADVRVQLAMSMVNTHCLSLDPCLLGQEEKKTTLPLGQGQGAVLGPDPRTVTSTFR